MAQQGKCPGCRAAFSFPERKGYPDCPHCGTTLAQTTHEYSRGPWFVISGARRDASTPAARQPDAMNPATRTPYYRLILAQQDAERAQATIGWSTRYLAQLAESATARPLEGYEQRNADSYRATLDAANAKHADAVKRIARYSVALEQARATVAA